MTGTSRLALPFLSPGQAQKELLHNEALQMLDVLVAAAVEEAPRTSPPAAPVEGSCYIVAPGADGDWAGKDNALAAFTSGGWRFVAPIEGIVVFMRASATWAQHLSGAWEMGALRGSSLLIDGQKVVGSRGSPIGDPAGGSTVDVQARAALVQVLAAMREHGLIEM